MEIKLTIQMRRIKEITFRFYYIYDQRVTGWKSLIILLVDFMLLIINILLIFILWST